MKNLTRLFTHNIGFNRARLTHREYVAYLFDCAARWRMEPNGREQAERVQAQAIEMQRTDPADCAVCKAASK